MSLYKLLANSLAVIRTTDGVFIPNDPTNADRIAYNKWLAVPNTPDAADAAPAALTAAQLAQLIANDTGATGTFMRGLVALLATHFSITTNQVVTAIANAAS